MGYDGKKGERERADYVEKARRECPVVVRRAKFAFTREREGEGKEKGKEGLSV